MADPLESLLESFAVRVADLVTAKLSAIQPPPPTPAPQPQPSQPTKLLLTKAEAAEFLSLSEGTIKNFVSRGELQAVRIGVAVRFDRRDLISWVEGKKIAGGPTSYTGKNNDYSNATLRTESATSN